MDETGVEDPHEAVRTKARDVISQFHQLFGGEPPFDVKAIASLRGLHWSDDDPRFSPDSEIAPESDGRVVLRVDKTRPLTRQRFSICHEVGHTLFPEYQLEVRCRKGDRRSFADPEDLLETLCDVAASELMFPTPWFDDCLKLLSISAENLAKLADDFEASRDATARRVVEVHPSAMAAVFFSWKLKPVEERELKASRMTPSLFPALDLPEPEPKLRVDYRIANRAFDERVNEFIPQSKSIPCEGPIFEASMSQIPVDGKQTLDFGRKSRHFSVSALPIYTNETAIGPNGGCSVVAILQPLD
ncbi:ImmA/IrrE family metallo-endopeptidase [Stieleria neptunia]|nr:ImmA/IrrE family metallo-endopeptidase [Stieleria neptunia]